MPLNVSYGLQFAHHLVEGCGCFCFVEDENIDQRCGRHFTVHTFDTMLHRCRLAVEAKPPQLSGHDLTDSACAEGAVLTSWDS